MILHPDEIINKFKENFEYGIVDASVVENQQGVTTKVTQQIIYLKVTRSVFHRAISFLKTIAPPHITCPMASKEYDHGLSASRNPKTLLKGYP